MMFVDGCFLVQVMDCVIGPSAVSSRVKSMIQPHLVGILRDIMLLENQIPWLVIKFLIKTLGGGFFSMEQLIGFLNLRLHGSRPAQPPESMDLIVSMVEDYKPAHLLSLTQFCVARPALVQEGPHHAVLLDETTPTLSTSAAELAAMGIKLKASAATTLFSDMRIVNGRCFISNLSLAPLRIDAATASWLVNIAAHEMTTTCHPAAGIMEFNSYLAVLSTLMTRVEDVRKLRRKGIVQGLNDKGTLEFIASLAPNLLVGQAYHKISEDLEAYKRKRWLRIAVYSFLLDNIKTIVTIVTVVAALVGIINVFLALRRH